MRHRCFEVIGCCLALWACAPAAASGPALFGGEGATVSRSPDEIPLAGADAPSPGADDSPCSQPAPPGDRVEIDDFEDSDGKIFKVFEREGWWYTATDGTEGEKVLPPAGTFLPEKLPAEEAGDDNEYAAHLAAEGQTDWGVVWGTTLVWRREGVGCPFNASGFEGIEFRAKGPATLWVNFNTPGTTPAEEGGKCREKCWDSYGKLVRLKEGWHHYVVRWEQLQQQGWGTDVRFDNTHVMNLNFSAKTEYLPTDFWLDDIRFLGKQPSRLEAPQASSAPARATSQSGQ